MVHVMDALSVVVVAIAAARLAIFGVIAALLVGVLALLPWMWQGLPVNSGGAFCLDLSRLWSLLQNVLSPLSRLQSLQ